MKDCITKTEKTLKYDYEKNQGIIYTKFEDGSVGVVDEPLNAEESAQWQAEHNY